MPVELTGGSWLVDLRLALGLGHQEGEEEAEQAAAGEREQRVADADAWRVAVRRRLGRVRALRQVKKPLQEEEWSDDGEFIELEGGFGIVAGDEEDDGGVSGVELERRLHEVTGSGWES
uniref:Uncharacterized protein n=1 Tax=Oryza barthii TaxID=65489 RepID=A0A0D3FXS9_9ORYZ